MLYELLRDHRQDLIERCRLKVSQRSSPAAPGSGLQYGVPLMLEQLFDALVREERSPTSPEDCVFGSSTSTADSLESGRAAGLHGAELFRLGYTVDQVVHDYGDLCQAVTELATEIDAPITTVEFHTFNRLLDDSIAGAVCAYVRLQHASKLDQGATEVHERLGTLAEEQRTILDGALKALAKISVGNSAALGATGAVLEDKLLKLRDLIDRALPQIRLASGMVSPPGPEPGEGKSPWRTGAGMPPA